MSEPSTDDRATGEGADSALDANRGADRVADAGDGAEGVSAGVDEPTASGAPALVASDLTKRYGATTAVDALEMTVDPGIVFGFLGPNGAGKTTTMRMFTGLVEPTAGEARVAGVPSENRRDLVDRIGLMPEEPPLYEELTGREQLQFAADLRDVAWDAVADRALSMCERLELSADLDRRIDGYSKGMRQKTAFVQAVQHDPAVAFLDEPTSGLDPRAAKTLRELILELAEGETTVFLSTHVLPVVEEIADEVGVLHQGQLVAEGPVEDLVASVEGAAGSEDAADRDAAGPRGDPDLEDAFLELTSDREAAWNG